MPPSRWKYPRVGEAWAECQWCSQEYPASLVWLNPRYGWQCYKCWDGLIQRDQYQQPIFPYEGTRRTPAPIVPEDEGVGGPLGPTYEYLISDRFTGNTYEVHIPPMEILPTGQIVYWTTSILTLVSATPTSDDIVYTEIQINDGKAIFVENGAIGTEVVPLIPPEGLLVGECDFGTIPSTCSVYMLDQETGSVYLADFTALPPTLTLATTSATVFDAVLAGNGWYVVISGDALFSMVAPPSDATVFTSDCIVEVLALDSTGSSPSEGGGGGGGVVPTPAAPTVICPSTSVTALSVDFTASVTLPAGVSILDYLWDFGDGTTLDTGATDTAHHDYTAAGTYPVVVTVTDNFGRQVSATSCPVTVAATIDGPPLPGSCIPTFGLGTGTLPSAYEISGGPYTIVESGGPAGQTTFQTSAPATINIKCPDACTNDGGFFYFQVGGTYTSCLKAGHTTNTHLTLTILEYQNSDCGDAPIVVATTAHSQGGFDCNYYQSVIGTKGALVAGRHYVFQASMDPGDNSITALYDVFLNFYVADPGFPPQGDTYLGQCC